MGSLAILRDRLIEDDVDDLLRHDPRLSGAKVEHRVDGGVVHLEGLVESRRQLDDLRVLLRRLRHVLAVWDVVAVADRDRPVVVDIGCGGVTQWPGALGVDRRVTEATSAVADLDDGLPLGDDTVDHLFAVHVIEHVRDPVSLLAEAHRVVRPAGVVHVMVPYWRDTIAVADPTHRHFFAPETFQAFCDGTAPSPPFRPLLVTRTDDTVLADLQPLTGTERAGDDDLACWFDRALT